MPYNRPLLNEFSTTPVIIVARKVRYLPFKNILQESFSYRKKQNCYKIFEISYRNERTFYRNFHSGRI